MARGRTEKLDGRVEEELGAMANTINAADY